jgi:hypothetical protein
MDQVEQLKAPLQGFRLCVQDHGGVDRRVAQINWSNANESLYIESYCPAGGLAYAGRKELPTDLSSFTFDVADEPAVLNGMPKMSLHADGNTKTELAGRRTKFVRGQPHFGAVGGHLATVQTNKAASLPILEDRAIRLGVMNVIAELSDPHWTSVRFPISVHTQETLARNFRFVVMFSRREMPAPLYVCVDVFTRFEPENDAGGVIVIGGWGTQIRPSEVSAMAFTLTREPSSVP